MQVFVVRYILGDLLQGQERLGFVVDSIDVVQILSGIKVFRDIFFVLGAFSWS